MRVESNNERVLIKFEDDSCLIKTEELIVKMTLKFVCFYQILYF